MRDTVIEAFKEPTDEEGQHKKYNSDKNQRGNAQLHPERIGSCLLYTSSWIGRGFDAFQREMRGEVLPAVTRLQNALGEAASTTNSIVQTMQSADEEASAPFRIS